MVKKTITLPNKILRKNSEAVSFPLNKEDKAIAENLIEYLKLAAREDNDLRPGVGIAAVQLGFLKRMFYVNFKDQFGEEEHELLINPEIISYSEAGAAISSGEGCLSVKESDQNQEGLVHRRNKIIIKGYSYFQKKEVELTKIGYAAIVYQHEMDHLNGKLFIDRIDQKNIWGQKDKELLV